MFRSSTRRRSPTDPTPALHDPARVAAVRVLLAASGSVTPELDELARQAASQLRAPSATISLLDADTQHSAGRFGLGGGPAGAARDGLAYEWSYCKHVVGDGRAFEVSDSLRTPLVRSNRATTDQGVRAYLGVPMLDRDGLAVGVVCVCDSFARKWNADDHAKLTRIAQLAARRLERAAAERTNRDTAEGSRSGVA